MTVGTGSLGHPGSVNGYIPELVGGDPSVGGLPRPIGWRVMLADGSAAWDKFGPTDTSWTPVGGGGAGPVLTVNGLNGNVTVPIQVVGVSTTGGTRISTIASASLGAGVVAWSSAIGAPFWLVPQGSLTLDPMTTIAASGKAGFVWQRVQVASAGASAVPTWHIDPVNGSDEASGTGAGAAALKTCAEWNRRTYNVTIGFVTVSIDNDIPDGDTFISTCNGPPATAFLFVQGSQTVTATQVLTASTARNAATNQANEITSGAFNWASSVNSLSRQQGTTNYAAVTKSISAGVARVGELINNSGSVSSSTGYANGVTVEVVQTRKGPLSMIFQGTAPVFMQDVRPDGAGTASITNVVNAGGTVLLRCVMGGTSSSISAPGVQMFGGLVKSSGTYGPGEYRGTAFTGGAYSFQAVGGDLVGYTKLRSTVWQASTLKSASVVLHIDGDLGVFDNAAATTQVDVNSGGVGEGAMLTFLTGRHYGSGNNGTSVNWAIGIGSYAVYLTASPPVATGSGVSINGGTTAFGGLPVPLSTSTGSAVYAR